MLKKINLKKSQILLIYITAGVLVVLFFDRFAIPRIQGRFKGSHDRVKLEEARLKRNLSIQSKKDEVLKEYELYKHYLERGPDDEKQSVAELLKEVENIVTAVGGVIISLTPHDKQQGTEYYKKYSVECRLEVSFKQLLRFLNKVRESKALIKMDKFVVSVVNKKTSILRLDGVVSLAVPN